MSSKGDRSEDARRRVQEYLTDPDSFTVGYSNHKEEKSSPFVTPSKYHDWPSTGPATRPTTRPIPNRRSSVSTASSSRRQSDSDASSQESDLRTTASSTSPPPRTLRPPWHTTDVTSYDYFLPCEFEVVGCSLIFAPEDYEDWIAHTRSHFVGTDPPSKAVCIFCDGPAGTFDYRQNPHSNWRRRMIHIGQHHMEHARGFRPDYFVLEHLYKSDLLTKADFDAVMEYSERQFTKADCLVPRNHKTEEMKKKEEREEREERKKLEVRHDLRKERQEMRKEKRHQKANRV